jgi:hypothetical protein
MLKILMIYLNNVPGPTSFGIIKHIFLETRCAFIAIVANSYIFSPILWRI